MKKKANKISLFENKPLDLVKIRHATLEEMRQSKEKNFHSKSIKKELLKQIDTNFDLVKTTLLEDSVLIGSIVDEELSKNRAFKEAQSPKTPKYINKYQKTNDKNIKEKINEEIVEHGKILEEGQVVLHGGGLGIKEDNTLIIDSPLSTTLNPLVAYLNHKHNNKAYDEGEININILTIKEENIIGFIFNNRTSHCHEKEVLLEKGLKFEIKTRIKIGDRKVISTDGKEKMVPMNITEIDVYKNK